MPSATKRESTSLVATPRGEERIDLYQPTGKARALLALGHGAGGGVDAPDLIAVKKAALAEKLAVALITQPYRVAGRTDSVSWTAWTNIAVVQLPLLTPYRVS